MQTAFRVHDMEKRRKLLAGGLLITVLLTVVDQVTKYLASSHLIGTAGVSVIPGVFELFYLENTGAAFGMLDNRQWFFIIIAVLMAGAAVYVYLHLPSESHYGGLRLVCILIASGAVGNMLDRILHGYVIDFLYFSLIHFPVFNVADCYVCVGAALAVILLFTLYRDDDFKFLIPKRSA